MGFSIGVDFGSLSARAMAVDVSNGRILKESVYGYPHGIMKESPAYRQKAGTGHCLAGPSGLPGCLAVPYSGYV